MGEFIPPTDGKATAKTSKNAFIPPTDSVEIKKKGKLEDGATPPESGSETPTGSSVGVNPAFKSSIASPIPDFNNLQAGKPNKKFDGLIPDKTKGFYQQGEEVVQQNKDIENGFSNKTEYVTENGKLATKTRTTYVSEETKNFKADYAKEVGKKSMAEYDANLTEENLQKEKEQSGVANTLGQVGKALWNVTGEGLSAVNETFGGDKGYFTFDEYKPLQDQKKQAKQDLEREGLPVTEETIQKKAEDIFRTEDKIQQIQKRVDANLPENYDRQGIWKELKLDNLKNNDKLRSAVATIDIHQKQIEDFNKYDAYVNSLPKENITQEKVDKYNSFLKDAQESEESLKYYRETFPKLLQEVKDSDELLDVMKFNYNDYEKSYSNITGFAKVIGMGTLKLAAETENYIDQTTGRDNSNTGYRQAILDVANEELDKNRKDKEQYIRYKAKDISNFSDGGSFMAQLGTEQLPVYATLILAPEMGLPLLGTSTAGDQFRNMEVEEMQPFAQQTTFGQKLATAYLYGSAETLFERLGTVGILKNIQKSVARASNASRKLIFEGAGKETLRFAKQLGLNTGIEGGTEYLTAEAQIGADRYVAGKKISGQQADERRYESAVAGGLMGNSMTLAGGVWGAIAQKAQLYSEGKDIKQTKAILSQIDLLSDELKNNPDLNADDKKIIYAKMNDLTNQSFDIVIKNSEKGANFSAKENQFLVDINTKQEELKQKFEELKNSNISKEQKELLTKDLNSQYGQLEKDRNGTLKGEFATIPDARKTISFEKKEENNLKDEEAPVTTATDSAPLPTVPENYNIVDAPTTSELDIKIERGGVFSGEFLNDYEFLAEGSEHTVYKSKDGKTVVKIGEPHNSNETYQARVDDALNINRLLGDGSLKVIGTYKSPNGTINPVYSQSFIDGKIATQDQVSEHLAKQGFIQTGTDTYVINDNGVTREISDTSDNFIINSDGVITAIDAAIKEVENEQNPQVEAEKVAEVSPEVTVESIEKRKQEFIKTSIERKGSELNEAENKVIDDKFNAELEALQQKPSPVEDVVAPSVEGLEDFKFKPNYTPVTPKTKNTTINVVDGAGGNSFEIATKDYKSTEGVEGATIIGNVKNVDFPGQPKSETRGEVFILQVTEKNKGTGTSLMLDALRLMKNNGTTTVKFTVPSQEGKPFNDALEAKGYIKKIQTDQRTGTAEYEIQDKVFDEGRKFSYNGEVFEESYLRQEYGNEFDKAIKDFGYKEVENESPSKSNPPADANVRPTATNVGESGIAIEESPAKKGVPKPVDGGEGKGDVEVGNAKALNKGVEEVQKNAKEYRDSFNQKLRANEVVPTLFEKVSKMMADAYVAIKNTPNQADVKIAYDALVRETNQQFDFIVSKGLEVIKHEGKGEPYASSAEMLSDLRDNNTLKFLPNEVAFGQGTVDVADNIGLQPSGRKLKDGYELTNSEVFRIVHDYFGHGILGNQFGAIGEENATLQHLDLYSNEAAPAVVFQTRGQNSWVNFSGENKKANELRKQAGVLKKQGKVNEANKMLEEADKIFKFAEPKIALFPKKFNFKRYDTARRINESESIDARSDKRDNDLSGLLARYSDKSRATRGVDKRDFRGTKRIGEFDVEVVSEINFDEVINNGILKAFPNFKGVQKVYEIKDGASYRKMMVAALENNPYSASVTVHSEADFNNMRMFVTEDGSTGITITKEGFLGGAFSNPKSNRPQNLAQLMILGIKEGATTAEAFDTILPDYYAQFGFKAVSRTAFNDEYRPLITNGTAVKDWNYKTYEKFQGGRPDIVFFIFDGDNRNTIEDRLGLFDLYSNYEKENTESFDEKGYDNAEKVMNQAAVKRLEFEQGVPDTLPKNIPETKKAETPTTKEKIAERIKLSDAKVDSIRDAISGIDSIFGIKIKIDDVDGLNKNGIDIVNVIASIAKQAIAAGIHIDEAINKTIEHLKKTIDFDVNIDEIKAKINPKAEEKKAEPKKTESKDLLAKMTDVPNSGEIGKYISRDNIEESDAEEEFTTNQDYDKLKLIDSLIYGKEIVEQAKADFGDNYIEELIKNINAIKNVDSKTLHIISLENDLRKRRKESTDVQEKEFLTEQINRLQPVSQKLANTVSRALNLNKLRKLSESGVNPNDKSNSIYTKEELETKHEIGKSFGKDINDIQEQYEESFQDETDAVETTPDNEENILKYSQEDFDRELQKAKDDIGNDYNISVFENLKRQAKKDKFSDKKEDLKAARAKVLEDIRKVVRESMGQTSVNPFAKPLEFAALVTKLAKLHIQDGALSLEEVANNIYNDLKDMSKDISKESIFNILKSKPKKVMSEATKRKIYIALLNKNIESLDAQIEAKKRDVINRVDKYKNDAEIKDLRDKRTEKRDELAKVDPSYAESRKFATDLNTAQKSLDEYQRRIDENELSPKENQPKVVAEKLKKLRERRDAKRKEFLAKKKKYDDSLKPVAVPPTKEELADKKYLADVNNKINSLTKRIEDLKANKPKTNDNKSTVWNAKISELENEVNRLKEIKNPSKKKQNPTEEEVFQKKIDQKIKQVEKALQDHKDKKPKFTVGANSMWSEELSAIKTELSNLRNENSDAKKKAREVKNKAIDLLVNSGYGKEINVTKKEVDANGNVTKVQSTKKILDWKKLAGESGSIANISKAIKAALADQNLSEKEINTMVAEMKTAIEEIKTSITEKSLSDLQNRNKIPKLVNVKTEAKNLSELYDQGIFDDNMDKYDVALNRILGFNQFRAKQYQDLKDYSRLLSGLFANKNIFNNEFMSEDALKTQVAHINKQINEIVNKASMGKGFTPQKIVSLIRDYSDMALLSKLLSLKQTIENPWSGFTERKYQQIGSMFDKIKLTPELKNHINTGAWSVFKDIAISGSPDLGDSSFSDIRSRKIDDKIRGIKMGKKAGKIRDAVSAIISGTVYLNGADSYNKVKILESVFAKAMIDILSNKNYGRNNTMTVKEATLFVSEALTGEGFDKAIEKAKEIIQETNAAAGKDVLPSTEANVYRLAMDIVRDNLTATGVVDAETVKAVFVGSFKAAGSSLGHEHNNAVSELYKKSSQEIDRKIREAVKKKDWVSFTKYVTLNIMKNITMPFVSGRFNWVVLAAQKSGANLGLSMLVTGNKKSKNKIDFGTEEGVKNLTEAVHWKIRHDLTVKRSVTGLALNVLAIAALAASGGDDEIEKLLEKSPILKKLFKWLGPPLLNLYLASQKGGKEAAFNFILDFYSVTGNEDRGSAVTQFNVLLNDKSTDKQNSKAWGYVGKMAGKAFDTPIPWRLVKDINNIKREIFGMEQYVPNYNATSFLSGLFQGGFFEAIGMREILSFGHEEEKYVPKDESIEGIMERRRHPVRKTEVEKRESRKSERENERELRIRAREEGVRYVAPRN